MPGIGLDLKRFGGSRIHQGVPIDGDVVYAEALPVRTGLPQQEPQGSHLVKGDEGLIGCCYGHHILRFSVKKSIAELSNL